MIDIKPGMVVKLQAMNSPLMTVVCVTQYMITCGYFTENGHYGTVEIPVHAIGSDSRGTNALRLAE